MPWGVSVERRVRRRRQMPGELAQDAGLTVEQEIVRVLSSVFDRLQHEITIRFTRLQDLNMKFGFLLDVENLVKCENLDALRQNYQDIG